MFAPAPKVDDVVVVTVVVLVAVVVSVAVSVWVSNCVSVWVAVWVSVCVWFWVAVSVCVSVSVIVFGAAPVVVPAPVLPLGGVAVVGVVSWPASCRGCWTARSSRGSSSSRPATGPATCRWSSPPRRRSWRGGSASGRTGTRRRPRARPPAPRPRRAPPAMGAADLPVVDRSAVFGAPLLTGGQRSCTALAERLRLGRFLTRGLVGWSSCLLEQLHQHRFWHGTTRATGSLGRKCPKRTAAASRPRW